MRSIAYTLFGTVLLFAPGDRAGAQASVEADSLAAAGDTVGALVAFDAILRRQADDADAHYRLGQLHRALFLGTPDTTLSLRRRRNWDRNRAERHFRRATEIAPDSAQYWLAWAEVLRTKTSMVSRFRVMDLVDSSVAVARRAARGRVIAGVGYRAARVEWERYEQMGHRYLFFTGTDVLAYSFTPLGRLANVSIDRVPATTGIIVKDQYLRDVARDVREHMATAGDTTQLDTRTWRLALAPGEYFVRVEAELPTIQRAARSSGVLAVRDFSGDTLLLSDILVARRLEARDSTFSRWSEFLIVPSAARLPPGAAVALLWEMYNLQPDSSGVAHYSVRLAVRVDAIERRGVFAQVIGGIGDATDLSALGDDRVVLEYNNDIAIGPGAAQAEYIVLDLRSDQQVTYEIELTVIDRSTAQAATVSRQFEVTSTPLRRGPP